MSLTDLKRKKPKVDRSKISVEDFIADANNYASGKPTLLAGQKSKPPKRGLDKMTTKTYRHATFTLTEASIAQLDEIAKESGIAKSKLLRILIKEFYDKSSGEQGHILQRRKDDHL
ncbi:ribbon-helix-helix domain-containing protein [Shewanella sedimentimangrovi]|uniref:CopG family transcriptional regulator n=1 Tax=Shewanella sedimentimangrovi TaxID=2814293 RepID=A0ABX7R6V4_9GAMM|nr:ribbon-helix-helix domain-containing protein [Shewanella sedimentimangrovi]QSX38526.1 CopG family transcriptional regulator [Shewanella sedimentimangrovi]